MNICIVGGGNIGTAMAVEFAHNDHKVNILTSRPKEWDRKIYAVDASGREIYSGELNLVTSDISAAFNGVDYVFVTLPSNVQADFAGHAIEYVRAGMNFVMMPGFGGAEFLMKPLIDRGVHLYGFQRVHAVARLREYGKSVWFDKKFALQFAALSDKNNLDIVRRDMEILFEIPCQILSNYLCITLTPSNPILHTARLYSMFRDFGQPLNENVLFYATWDDRASEMLLHMDDEVQNICRSLTEMDLTSVTSLKVHYESDSVPAMTRKLRSIQSLSKIPSPMKQTSEGWIPDIDNRYFVCDFGYGLDILLQFAEILNVDAPTINEVMAWYSRVTNTAAHKVNLRDYDLQDKEDIYNFYGVI